MGMQKPSGWFVSMVEQNITIDFWPADDEDVAFRLAEAWHKTAADVRNGATNLDNAAGQVVGVWGDEVGQQFHENAMLYGYQYRELAKLFDDLGVFAHDYGVLIQQTKDGIMAELVKGLADALLGLLIPGPAGWGRAAAVAARTAVRIGAFVARMASTTFGRLALAGLKPLVSLGREAAFEALDEGVTNLIEQGAANLRGTQQGVDWTQVGRAAATGAVSTPLSRATRGLTNLGGGVARRMGAPSIPNNAVTRSISSGGHNAVTSPVAGHLVETYEQGGDFTNVQGYVDAIKQNGVQSAVVGGARAGISELGSAGRQLLHGTPGGPPGPPVVEPGAGPDAAAGGGDGAGGTGPGDSVAAGGPGAGAGGPGGPGVGDAQRRGHAGYGLYNRPVWL